MFSLRPHHWHECDQRLRICRLPVWSRWSYKWNAIPKLRSRRTTYIHKYCYGTLWITKNKTKFCFISCNSTFRAFSTTRNFTKPLSSKSRQQTRAWSGFREGKAKLLTVSSSKNWGTTSSNRQASQKALTLSHSTSTERGTTEPEVS